MLKDFMCQRMEKLLPASWKVDACAWGLHVAHLIGYMHGELVAFVIGIMCREISSAKKLHVSDDACIIELTCGKDGTCVVHVTCVGLQQTLIG